MSLSWEVVEEELPWLMFVVDKVEDHRKVEEVVA